MKIADAPLPTFPLPPVPAVADGPAVPRVADYITLVKPRLALMVQFTVAAAFLLAAGGQPDWLLLVHTLAGTTLVAYGASVLNQLLERDTDALMERTRNRPLPAGRVRPLDALRFGALLSAAGVVWLAVLVNPLTSLLAVITLGSYVFAYTPLKRRTTVNTAVGAVSGALPPVIGWAGATGQIDLAAGALFLIRLVWQCPHFWAIAWIYRRDYARAGLQMVPVRDRDDGRMTGRLMVNSCLALLPVSLLPALVNAAGPRYALGALVLGTGFLAVAVRFLVRPSDAQARRVLWASLVYLPLILTFVVLDGTLLLFPDG